MEGRLKTISGRKILRKQSSEEISEDLCRVLSEEAAAIIDVSGKVNSLVSIVELVVSKYNSGKNLFFSGMGKCSFVAGKLASTFSSLGIPSFELDCANALHGDVGKVRRGDLVFILSKSGETEETLLLAGSLSTLEVTTVAVTCNYKSTLYNLCSYRVFLDIKSEACHLGLAPTTSSTCMLAVGDAIGVASSRCLGTTKIGFAKSHTRGVLCK